MIEETVDYKALYEQVQQELEAARIAILNMRNATGIMSSIDIDSIRDFVAENYMIIVLVFLLLSFIVSSLKVLKSLLTKP